MASKWSVVIAAIDEEQRHNMLPVERAMRQVADLPMCVVVSTAHTNRSFCRAGADGARRPLSQIFQSAARPNLRPCINSLKLTSLAVGCTLCNAYWFCGVIENAINT